jgi:hypothetical protein
VIDTRVSVREVPPRRERYARAFVQTRLSPLPPQQVQPAACRVCILLQTRCPVPCALCPVAWRSAAMPPCCLSPVRVTSVQLAASCQLAAGWLEASCTPPDSAWPKQQRAESSSAQLACSKQQVDMSEASRLGPVVVQPCAREREPSQRAEAEAQLFYSCNWRVQHSGSYQVYTHDTCAHMHIYRHVMCRSCV